METKLVHCERVEKHQEHDWETEDRALPRWHCNSEAITPRNVDRIMDQAVDAGALFPKTTTGDMVNHPPHYTNHPSGVEVIEITRHMGFNLGNVIKYVLRCDLKKDAIEDLKKAAWYLADEIAKREKAANGVQA